MHNFKEALQLLQQARAVLNLAPAGAFKNGVSDASGTMDEGETRACDVIGWINEFVKEAEKHKPLLNVGDTAFYMRDNRIHSATIMCRRIIDNAKEDYAHFGEASVAYWTCHGELSCDEVFTSRSELIQFLANG